MIDFVLPREVADQLKAVGQDSDLSPDIIDVEVGADLVASSPQKAVQGVA